MREYFFGGYMKKIIMCLLVLISISARAGVEEVSSGKGLVLEPRNYLKNTWEFPAILGVAYYSNNASLGDENVNSSSLGDENINNATLGDENVNDKSNIVYNNINISKNDDIVSAEQSLNEASVKPILESEKKSPSISVIPMGGGIIFAQSWSHHVKNRSTIGLSFEIPITNNIALEGQGFYGSYYVSYSYFGHNFNIGGLGGNAKLYFLKGTFNPFINVGLMWLNYSNMRGGPTYPYYYNKNIGSGELGVGGEVEVASNLYFGLRGSLLWPLLNRPYTLDNGLTSAPGFEEAALINTSFYKFMGSIKFTF